MQIKVPIGVEKMNNRHTLAQWLVEPRPLKLILWKPSRQVMFEAQFMISGFHQATKR